MKEISSSGVCPPPASILAANRCVIGYVGGEHGRRDLPGVAIVLVYQSGDREAVIASSA